MRNTPSSRWSWKWPARALLSLLVAALAMAADTPSATPGGATFTAPDGWSTNTGASSVTMDAPERDTHVAIVDVHAPDATAAVSAAWKIYKPDSKRPLRVSVAGAARNGWDQRQNFEYETSPNERADVEAIALRAGDAWTVAI